MSLQNRVMVKEPIRKELTKSTFHYCYVHPFPADYYMDWSGAEMVFHTQPMYIGNFFEIMPPGENTGSYTDELQYVHAVDYELHFCYIITVPFTTRRAFVDQKSGGGVTSVNGFLHFANYQLENICAIIDSTNHDCSFH